MLRDDNAAASVAHTYGILASVVEFDWFSWPDFLYFLNEIIPEPTIFLRCNFARFMPVRAV